MIINLTRDRTFLPEAISDTISKQIIIYYAKISIRADRNMLLLALTRIQFPSTSILVGNLERGRQSLVAWLGAILVHIAAQSSVIGAGKTGTGWK